MNVFKTALLASVAIRTFGAGWKMDGDKIATDADGNPIYINAAGQEQSMKGDTIATLNAEARQHRTAKETAETNLAKYKGADGKLIDPDIAVKAIDTVGKIDAKQLIDAGKVDEVRKQVSDTFTAQINDINTKYTDAQKRIADMSVDKIFDGSDFIRDRVAIPRDFFAGNMRNHFKFEDGKITAYDRAGNPVYSKKNPGTPADPEEALELLVEAHPQKDTILKAASAGGSGNGGGGGSRGGGRTVTRAQFGALSAAEQAQTAAAAAKGEVTLTD